jgi:hypothetical protein
MQPAAELFGQPSDIRSHLAQSSKRLGIHEAILRICFTGKIFFAAKCPLSAETSSTLGLPTECWRTRHVPASHRCASAGMGLTS